MQIAEMTMNDWELVEKAKKLPTDEYRAINDLILRADTDRAKLWLRSIRNTNFHTEEFYEHSL